MNFALLTAGDSSNNIVLFGGVLLMVLVLYFAMWRPQRKKENEAKEKQRQVEIGDEITTIGGIVGRVVSLKEDTFVLETAGDRSRMRFKRWAIQEVGKLSLDDSTSKPVPEPTPEKKSLFGGLFGGKKNDDSADTAK